MAENPFDLYDEAAPTVTPTGPATEDDNPFSAFDGEQPPQPKAPASQPPAPPTPVQNMPGVSVIDDAEMRDFLDAFEAQNMRDGTDKLNEARGRGFIDGITDPQQYLEYGKGLPGTALDTVVGRPLRAAGTYKTAGEINAGEFQRRQISTFDRIDRGERIADMDDPVGYQHMTPAQRQLARAQVERAAAVYAATPVKEQALHKAGEAVQKYSKTILPAIPGYEDSVGRQLGEGSGSLLGSIATGVVGRVLGVGSGLMVATSAMGGTSEAVDRAIEFDRKERAAGRAGLTDADFVSVGISGVGPGATDLVPLEFLLRRLKLPPEVTKATARVIARIGGQAFIEGIQEGGQQFWQNEIARERYDPSQSLTEGVLPNMAFGGGVGAIAQASKELGQFALRRFAGRRASGSAGQPSGQPTAPGVAPRAAASPDQAPSQATKAPSSQPEAAPTPTIRRDAAPETRAAAREQFNQYLALEERLAVIPDDVDAPPELINEAIDAEEAMVEAFRATGLPGDNLARGTRPINSMDDVRRAFDEATPEEINEFWQGKAVGPAASGAVVGAGATAQGDATGQVRTAAPVEEGGPGSAPAEPSPTLRLEKSAGNATVYDAMIDDVVHAQVSIKLHPKDKSIEVLSIGSDRKQGKLKPEFVGKIKAALVQQFPDYETAFGQEVGESAPLRPSAHDLTTDFLRLIATPAPRDQWAQTLGVSEDELMPHVERAIASGLLRVDRNGVVRRNASAVTAMEPETEAENQKIEDAVASGAGPLLAPGIISGESVTLTPKALGKIQQLQAIAEKAVAKILPRDVRIDVVDNIKIARLAREDELLSLRAFHGSPHDFDRFDNRKALSGIGHQTYGAGISLSNEKTIGEAFSKIGGTGGVLYEVSVDTDESRLLDFDLPLGKQSPHVREAIAKIDPAMAKRLSGDMVYDELMHGAVARTNSEASAALREAGIDGIRYTVAGAKGTQYTIFDDSLIKIVKKNGKPVSDQLYSLRSSKSNFLSRRSHDLIQQDSSRVDFELPKRIAPLMEARRAVEAEMNAKDIEAGSDKYFDLFRKFDEITSKIDLIKGEYSDAAARIEERSLARNSDPDLEKIWIEMWETSKKRNAIAKEAEELFPKLEGSKDFNIRRRWTVLDQQFNEISDKLAEISSRYDDRIAILRSSLSGKVSEGTQGESDGLQEDSTSSGQEGNDASQSTDAGAVAATVGGGGASGASAAEGRILRQESATLRADGSIRAGRISAAGRALPSVGNAESLQQVGTSERFDTPGFRGVVTANRVAPHADLDARRAPPSQYRLANLTYRLYAEETPISDDQLKHDRGGRFQANFRADGESHTPLIWAMISQHMDGTWEVSSVNRVADAQMAPRGMAAKLYAAIEKDLGIRMSPSGYLSPDGYAMWQKRSPESVQWHQKSKSEQDFYISPRRIKDRLPEVGKQIKLFAAKMAENPGDAIAKADWEGARKERSELMALWTKLPLEARGATPNTMFSLRAYHGTPHDFDRFDLGKIGTGEGAQAYGHGLYFAENKGIADHYRKTLTYARSGPSSLIVDGERIAANNFSIHQWIANELSHASDQRVDGIFPGDVLDALEEQILENNEYWRDDPGLDTVKDEEVSIQSGLALLKRMEGKVVEFGRDDGALYEVEIDIEPEKLLDWDAPLTDQPAKIQEAIRSLGIEPVKYREGKWLYHELAWRKLESPAEASAALRKAGIPGLRYRDAASRDITMDGKPVPGNLGAWAQQKMDGSLDDAEKMYREHVDKLVAEMRRGGKDSEDFSPFVPPNHQRQTAELLRDAQATLDQILEVQAAEVKQADGTRNIVVFDDSLIKITHKNGKPVTAQERQDVVDQMFSLRASASQPRTPTEVRVYHGTTKEFETFDVAQSKYDGDFYFTTDPYLTDRFSGTHLNRMYAANAMPNFAEGGRVIPAFIETKDFKAVDMDGYVWRDDGGERLKAEVEQAKSEGYEGLQATNVRDEGVVADQYVAWTKGTVRSALSEAQMFSARQGEQGIQALGQTDPIARTISLGVRAIEAEAAATGKTEERVTIEAARHEVFEYLLEYGVIQPNEWKVLTETALRENWIAEIGTAEVYAEQNKGMPKAELDALILKEAIMERFGRYERGEYQPKGVIAKLFKRIKDFLDRLREGLKGQGFQRWEDIFQKMEEGEMRRRYEAIYGAPAAESKGRATSKAAPAGDRIAAMTLPGLAPNAPLSPAPAGPTPGRAASAPGSLVDIQRNLRRKLGLTVASGRLDPAASRAAGKAGGKLMGQFDRRTEVIRLRTLQDIDTESHEVAHALENRYAGIANLQQAHVQELDGVANLTGQSGLSEGFAEFFRLYLTNPPAADAHAPRFRAAFEDFIETEDAQVLQDIQEIQAQYQQWRDASSAGRITAAIKSGVPEGTWEKIESDYQKGGMTRIKGRFSAFLDRVYKNVFDKTNPIRVLVQRIAEHAQRTNQDIDLSAWRNPHVQAGKIPLMDSAAYMDITRGVGWANSAGHGSVSLNDALATAFGGRGFENWTPEQRDAFGAYLIARRGRWLWQRHDMDPARNRGRMANPPLNPQNGDWYFDTMARQRRVYLRGRWEAELTRAPDKHSRADHEMTVAEMEAANPQFAVAAQMVYQFNRDLALKRFQAGLDSQEEFDYKNGATDYVPWFRDMTDRIFSGTAASGRKVQGKFKIRGSYRDFINPVEGIIRQVYDTNREIAVNKPKLLLAQLADGVKGAGQFAEIIPATRMEVQEVRVRDALAQAAREEGIPPEDAKNMISAVAAMIGDDAVAKIFKSKQAGDGGDAILHYMDGGELKMLQLHDDEYGLARDIIGFFEVVKHTPAADGLFKMIAVIARLPQKFITSSIEFAYNNLIRDTMTASVLQAGFVPVASQAQTIRDNRAKRARGEETWGEILARHGGIMGGLNTTHIRMARQGRILDLGAEGAKYMPWDYRFWTRTVNDGFWNVIEAPEGMTRQTLARLSFDRALKDVQTTYPSMPADQQTFVALETAVQKSRDYADYSRMGDLPSILGFVKLVPFLNPALQGTDKSARAVFRAQDAQGQYQAAEILRKKIAPLFDPEWLIKQRKPGGPGFKNLTKAQVGALKGAAYAWVGICIIAVTHLMIEILFNDEDELEDKSQLERATSVSFTINGIGYRIPRGFDIINVVSNAVRATYASWKREDPTAWKQFRQTLGASLMPPTSSPLLDLYIGWKHERNNFFNSPIEQEHQQGLLPEDRYTAYTSNLSRRISEIANPAMPFDVSPVMVEYSMNAIGSQWSRDILRTYDVFDPSKPAIKWQDYPFIRGARGLRGSRGAEEFWDLMGQEGKFAQAAGSYTTKEAKNWDRDSIRKFFDVRLKDDDAKAYAIMKRHYDPEQRRLHPLIRAHEMTAAVSGVMRDVSSNNITVAITSKIERKPEISREVRGQAMDILAEINRREYRNALIALKRPGYENRNPQPVKPYLQELKALSPDIHRALMGKINKSKGPTVYDYDRVREAWPEVRRKVLSPEKRERIIESEGDVEFSDLLGRAQGPKAMGIR